MERKIQVLLVDDHPLMIMGLKAAIEGWEEFGVAGTAQDGREAVEQNKRLRPDLIIMDMRMPGISGPEAACTIKKDFPKVRILAFTACADRKTAADAVHAGCDGFLLKTVGPQKLRSSLLAVAGGIHVFDESVMEALREPPVSKEVQKFSARELEILRFLCRGLTNPEIAERLDLKAGTVKNLITQLFSKTNCSSRSQLVCYAVTRHIAE